MQVLPIETILEKFNILTFEEHSRLFSLYVINIINLFNSYYN